ncbi:hypothetical protein M0813_08167 [Anaeramoeba flamelloides]|uniref:Uncharacterized protein n=1 Tax=Anaeramoeba flamelloides TaxID=1746091 RepID=A0ABQ8XAU3_9EUKA|nr:hypothetical protein M0813_08167 [Anaeramoeba flamelloides]
MSKKFKLYQKLELIDLPSLVGIIPTIPVSDKPKSLFNNENGFMSEWPTQLHWKEIESKFLKSSLEQEQAYEQESQKETIKQFTCNICENDLEKCLNYNNLSLTNKISRIEFCFYLSFDAF